MPAKIEYLLPEGSQRYQHPPAFVCGDRSGVPSGWRFQLEDTKTLEHRMLVVLVDEEAQESRYYKGPNMDYFPPSRMLGKLASDTCVEENLVAVVKPGEPFLDAVSNDKVYGQVTFAITHFILDVGSRAPQEETYIHTQLSQGMSQLNLAGPDHNYDAC